MWCARRNTLRSWVGLSASAVQGALVDLLVDEYALSPQANHRKGGLIGLAAATVGLAADHEMFLKARPPTSPALYLR